MIAIFNKKCLCIRANARALALLLDIRLSKDVAYVPCRLVKTTDVVVVKDNDGAFLPEPFSVS